MKVNEIILHLLIINNFYMAMRKKSHGLFLCNAYKTIDFTRKHVIQQIFNDDYDKKIESSADNKLKTNMANDKSDLSAIRKKTTHFKREGSF